MIPFLEKEHRGQSPAHPPRTAHVQVILRDNETNKLIELLVDLQHETVLKEQHLPGKHSYIDPEYMRAVETACMADHRIQDEIKKLQLPANASVIVEPWAYATDGMNDMTQRITMVSLPTLRRYLID